MRMTVVIDELNEGHAVLMIRTDRGDYILDNKTNAVLPWDETGYVYVKREGQDSMAWTSLGGVDLADRDREPLRLRAASQSSRRSPFAKRFQFRT